MHFAQCSEYPKILLQINLDYHEQRKLLVSIVEKLPNRNQIELLIENDTMDSSTSYVFWVKFLTASSVSYRVLQVAVMLTTLSRL